MSDKIQMTEDQARELFNTTYPYYRCADDLSEVEQCG